MCRFCVEHGEGERWYLQASNYAYDLDSDLKRRSYVVNFIAGFDTMRANAIRAGEYLSKMPRPLAKLGSAAISSHMQRDHFGQPLSLEDVERVLDIATSITVIPCICRMHEPNMTADEVCFLVTTKPIDAVLMDGFKDYDRGPDLDDFHELSKEDALARMSECERAGLMHSVWTFNTPFTAAICNCNLASGCMAMRMTARYGVKVMWRGEDVALLDADRCTRCGQCKRICPFSAISSGRDGITLHAEKCWGCGICRSACSEGAISLVDRRGVTAVSAVW